MNNPFTIFIDHATGENEKNTHRLGIFTEHQTAVIATIGHGSWGGNGAVEKAHAITVEGKTYLLKQAEPITIDTQKNTVLEDAGKRRSINSHTTNYGHSE